MASMDASSSIPISNGAGTFPPKEMVCVAQSSWGTAPWLRTTCKFTGEMKPWS